MAVSSALTEPNGSLNKTIAKVIIMRLDKETMRVLAVDTRVEILKQLKERRKMPSELSKTLGKNKSTISEHLKILSNAGLVQKTPQGKKWVYYSLTDKGRTITTEKPVEAMVVLALAMLSFIAGLYNIFSFYSAPVAEPYAAPAAKEIGPAIPETATAIVVPNYTLLYFGAAFIIIGVAAAWIYWKKYK